MPEPQLSVRSAKAIELAHRLRRLTGRTIGELVEAALTDLEAKLLAADAETPLDRAWAIAAADRASIAPATTAEHDDLYDQQGLPR